MKVGLSLLGKGSAVWLELVKCCLIVFMEFITFYSCTASLTTSSNSSPHPPIPPPTKALSPSTDLQDQNSYSAMDVDDFMVMDDAFVLRKRGGRRGRRL